MLLSTTLQEIPVANLPWILDLWGAVPLSSSEFSQLCFVAACWEHVAALPLDNNLDSFGLCQILSRSPEVPCKWHHHRENDGGPVPAQSSQVKTQWPPGQTSCMSHAMVKVSVVSCEVTDFATGFAMIDTGSNMFKSTFTTWVTNWWQRSRNIVTRA